MGFGGPAGFGGPMGLGGFGPTFGWGGFGYGWGGPMAPTWYGGPGVPSDDEIRDMIYDALDADPIIPYDADITVDVSGGVVTLRGTVPNKRVKHAAGDDAWWVPGVWDINNELQIVGRRERAAGEGRPAQAQAGGRATTGGRGGR